MQTKNLWMNIPWQPLSAGFVARLNPMAVHPISKPFTAWVINGREARQNETYILFCKTAVPVGYGIDAFLHVCDYHKLFLATKQRVILFVGGATVTVCPSLACCADADIWEKQLALFTSDLCQTLDHMIAGSDAPDRPRIVKHNLPESATGC